MRPAALDQRRPAALSAGVFDSARENEERAYTIRYRSTEYAEQTALIIEDAVGVAYLFCKGELRAQRSGAHASARLRAILSRYGAWTRIPQVAPYTLASLRALVGLRGDN